VYFKRCNSTTFPWGLASAVLLLGSLPLAAQNYQVGDTGPAGGYIFYVDTEQQFEWDALEIAPEDTVASGIYWGAPLWMAGPEAKDPSLGAGAAATVSIVQTYGETDPLYNKIYAARYLYDLEVEHNGQIFDDWFLPSLEELLIAVDVLQELGLGFEPFSTLWHWTSTEVNEELAKLVKFRFGSSALTEAESMDKTSVYTDSTAVRGIRAVGASDSFLRMLRGEIEKPEPDYSSFEYAPGDRGPAGGLIAYVDVEDAHYWTYMEAAPKELEFRAPWGNPGTRIGGMAARRAIGAGPAATRTIASENGPGEYAARIALDLVHQHDGRQFRDWYVPSLYELHMIFEQLHKRGLGDFSEDRYWSSNVDPEQFSDAGRYFARSVAFSYQGPGRMETTKRGAVLIQRKQNELLVRPVRFF